MEAQEGREKMQIGRESKNPVRAVSPENSKDRKAETSKEERNVRNDDPTLKVLPLSERSEPAPSVAKLAKLGGIGGPAQNKMAREKGKARPGSLTTPPPPHRKGRERERRKLPRRNEHPIQKR